MNKQDDHNDEQDLRGVQQNDALFCHYLPYFHGSKVSLSKQCTIILYAIVKGKKCYQANYNSVPPYHINCRTALVMGMFKCVS